MNIFKLLFTLALIILLNSCDTITIPNAIDYMQFRKGMGSEKVKDIISDDNKIDDEYFINNNDSEYFILVYKSLLYLDKKIKYERVTKENMKTGAIMTSTEKKVTEYPYLERFYFIFDQDKLIYWGTYTDCLFRSNNKIKELTKNFGEVYE